MDILDYFEVDTNKDELITFVGAGGKTTTMFRLAEGLKKAGKKVLVTTTTAIYFPQCSYYDNIFIGKSCIAEMMEKAAYKGISVLGSLIDDQGKLRGADKYFIDYLYNNRIFDYILVEGDGSKRRPVKAPAVHEPVIPERSTKVVGIIGMSSYGMAINSENVHRPELFRDITDSNINDIIDEEKLIRLILADRGLFKSVPYNSKKYLILTQVTPGQNEKAAEYIVNYICGNAANIKGNILYREE